MNAAIVFIYLAAMVALGVYLTRYVRAVDDFTLAGRSLNHWVIAGTIMATNVAAIYLVGPAGAAYAGGGASVLLIAWTGNMIAAVSALFFVPRLRRLRITTVSEFLETRYGLGLRLLPAALWIVYYALFAGNAMYTLAVVLDPVLPVSTNVIILFVGGGVMAYCFFSGLIAAVYSSVIQSFLMVLGGLILLPLSLKAVGGLAAFAEKMPDRSFQFWRSTGQWPTWEVVVMFILLGLPYWCTSQYMLQRSFAGRSVRDASKGLILAALLTGPLTLSYIIPGMCGTVLYSGEGELAKADAVIPVLLRDFLPVGLAGLIIAALVAASNSTASALLNSLATLTENDFYKRFAPDKPTGHYVWAGRLATLAGGAVGLLFAFNVERLGGIIRANFEIMSFFEPPIFVIVAAALFWRRTTAASGVLSVVGGVAFAVAAFFCGVSAAWRAILAFPLCGVLLAVGTFVERRLRPASPDERARIDELLSRMRGIRPDFTSRRGWAGVALSVVSLAAFVLCSVFESRMPGPANVLIVMCLMMAFVLGCFLAVPMFVPDEREGVEAEAAEGAIGASLTHRIVGSGWTWLAVYMVAGALVVLLYFV